MSAIYTSKSLDVIKRIDLCATEDEFETLWIEVKNQKKKNILCCCSYRHPSSNPLKYREHLEFIFHKIAREKKNIFIMGDFNINLLNYENHPETNEFLNSMNVNSFLPYILQPTRITERSATLIDNIFANISSYSSISGNLITKIADHLPQFLIVENLKINYRFLHNHKYDFTDFNEIKFINDFGMTYWSFLSYNNYDTNRKCDIFYDTVSSCVNKYIHRRKLSKKEVSFSSKPWITNDIRKMMKIRDKLYRHLIKKGHEDSVSSLFKKFRNRIVKDIRESKKSYYKNFFTLNLGDMKKICSGIRSIINYGKYKDSFISSLSVDKKCIDDPRQMSDIINSFFTNIGRSTEHQIPKGKFNALSYLKGNYPNSLFLSPATPSEVSLIISELNTNKSVGPNSIPVFILKLTNTLISHPLSQLINDSFESGIYPNLKLAKITPIFKKGLRDDIDNYRPISVLPVFSKIFDKIMYKRLYHYLEFHHILYPLQFGFREQYSTSHALISISELIRKSIDDREFGCGIFIDLRKAFDTVNHSILLSKLNHYGIRGNVLNWFQSYLSNREQFVCVNGHNSSSLTVSCGVPHGSVLGPLLFLLYVNDLPNSSNLLKFHLFADDTNIYFSSNDLSYLQETINNELLSVAEWMKSNRLAINVKKTNLILFHSIQHKPSQSLSIKINDALIDEVTSAKYLGITFDSNLTWKKHINDLCMKLSKTVGLLAKVRHFVNSNILCLLYYSLIYPFLIYGLQVWGLTYPSYLKSLFIIQKKAIRIIPFSDPRAHSEPLFKHLGMLK